MKSSAGRLRHGIDVIPLPSYIHWMAWEVEVTDEFKVWWNELAAAERRSIAAIVEVLEVRGPSLGRPYVERIHGSKYPNMKELRVQHAGEPYRILFAFDPRSFAILLVGGNKTGDERWYQKFVPVADRIYEDHLRALKEEKRGDKI